MPHGLGPRTGPRPGGTTTAGPHSRPTGNAGTWSTTGPTPRPCGGRPRACIGHRTAEEWDLAPARFLVRRTIRKTYACDHCEPTPVDPTVDAPAPGLVVTAGPPQVGPIPKGVCGPGLRAHVVTAKFADPNAESAGNSRATPRHAHEHAGA